MSNAPDAMETKQQAGETQADRSDEGAERLKKAETDWKKLEAEISPFVTARRFREYSTAGEWRETGSTLMRSSKPSVRSG